MRYYDCISFFNENDLLWLRLNELKPLNPIHVIVEASHTHTGDPKPFNFDVDRFGGFDIRYIQVNNLPNDGDAWHNENEQRNMAIEGLYDANDEDIIGIFDLDEIPRPAAIWYYDPRMNIAAFCMDKYSCYLNLLEGIQNWKIGKICTYEMLKKSSPNEIRNCGPNFIINYAGWHMSFMGGVEKMREKLFAYAHAETVTADLLNNLERKFNEGESLWGRDKWRFVKIDKTFPKYLQEHQDEFAHLIKQL